ncbi:bacterio-opsin activator domain-containing protein [Natrononativus amylolyticus]|uniref:bacterio-opsin activator domain-containing protein n=1 Tax=Natrononativus amylolyticus TaxID=2963434 RepID=UPI0020CDAB2F|nr:bacterio-opsin activator domain-containing protein [Natrononativus amylolyticus]
MESGDRERGGEIGDGTRAMAALEAVVDPVVAVADGTVTYANDAAREAFSLSSGDEAADALGPLWERLREEVAETTVGTARRVELADDRFDARVHRAADGATIAFATLEADVSTSDRAVTARAVNEAPVGVTISDPSREDNPLVYINRAYREITGYSADEVVGRNCRFLQGPDSDPEAVAAMREAIADERPVTVELKNYRKDGTEFWNEVTIAPVRNADGERTHYVGFQNDISARKVAELEAERRREELEYLLERVEGVLQDVTSAIAGSTARENLEATVCERIAEESAYDGVWIGERNPVTDAVDVRASAGVDPEPPAPDSDHPAVTTLATGEPAIASADGATIAAFPLAYSGVEYGVLTVRIAGERGVNDRESTILSALARAVASGINARETSRMLATDAVVAVDVEFTDRSIAPVALTAGTDSRLEYRRSVHATGDETTSLFTATGGTAAELAAAAAELEGIDLEVLVDRGDADSRLLEVTSDDDLVSWLSERGVGVRSIEAEAGRARATLEVPRSASVRSVVEAIEDRYAGTDVISFRQRTREGAGNAPEEIAVRLEEELTERQFAALQLAYLGGYFEWPRPATGEELAGSMGVSRPTFHEHLRAAELKLCRAFFGDE